MGCGFSQPTVCPAWEAFSGRSCGDKLPTCKTWAQSGECKANPGFMMGSCQESCGECNKPLATDAIPAWADGLARSRGGPSPARLDAANAGRGGGGEGGDRLAALPAARVDPFRLRGAQADVPQPKPTPKPPKVTRKLALAEGTGAGTATGASAAIGGDSAARVKSSAKAAAKAAAKSRGKPTSKLFGGGNRTSPTEQLELESALSQAQRQDEANFAARSEAESSEGRLSTIKLLFGAVWMVVLALCLCVLSARICRRRAIKHASHQQR